MIREELQLIDGIKITTAASTIMHLFFAEDGIIFSRANLRAADTISQVIQAYEWASGQQVNLVKTKLTFNKNVLEEVKISIQERIGVEAVKKLRKIYESSYSNRKI